MNTIIIPAKITRATRIKDGVSLMVKTVGDVDSKQFGEIDALLNQAGYLLFGPQPADPQDIPQVPVSDMDKTPSERLRAVLFVWYKNHPKKDSMDFEQF